MSEERRREPRLPLQMVAEVGFTNWEVLRMIYTINISRGGMNIELPRPPKVGSSLTVRLTLPTGQHIDIDAEVRHVTPLGRPVEGQTPTRHQVGVQFKNLVGKKLELLDLALKAHPAGVLHKK